MHSDAAGIHLRDRGPDARSASSPSRPGAAALAAAVALVLSATTVVLAQVDSRPGPNYQLHTILFGSDLALLALVVVAAGGVRAAIRSWRRQACGVAALVLGLSLLPALLASPSDRGVAAVLRWAGAVALALSLGSVRRDGRRLVVGAVAGVTLAHVAVAVAERINGGPVGLGRLGEPPAYEIGGVYASTGLTVHPYTLGAWCAVAGTALLAVERRRGGTSAPVRFAGVAAFLGIGLTLGRSGALAGGLALAALGWSAWRSRDRAWRRTVLLAGAALAVGVLVNLPGWISRSGESSAPGVDAVSNGRVALLRQAWTLLRDNFPEGVGPGRYVLALVERPDLVALSSQEPLPVHVTPLLVLVEGGLFVLPALLLLGLAIGRSCLRGGATAVALTLAMAPFLALDALAWVYPQGIVLTGVWLGVLDLLGRRDDDAPAVPDEPAVSPAFG